MHSGAASKRGATHRHGYWSHEEDDEHRRGTSEGRTSASVGEKTTTRMSGMPGLGAPAAQGPPRGRPRMMDALPKWTPRKSTFETGVFEILSQRCRVVRDREIAVSAAPFACVLFGRT